MLLHRVLPAHAPGISGVKIDTPAGRFKLFRTYKFIGREESAAYRSRAIVTSKRSIRRSGRGKAIRDILHLVARTYYTADFISAPGDAAYVQAIVHTEVNKRLVAHDTADNTARGGNIADMKTIIYPAGHTGVSDTACNTADVALDVGRRNVADESTSFDRTAAVTGNTAHVIAAALNAAVYPQIVYRPAVHVPEQASVAVAVNFQTFDKMIFSVKSSGERFFTFDSDRRPVGAGKIDIALKENADAPV